MNWYGDDKEPPSVIPFNQTYSYPSQANKAIKSTPKIPPKGGNQFSSGNVIKIDLPAQGYLNCANTTLAFDLTLEGVGKVNELTYLQNCAQSVFARVRFLYGSNVIEDIQKYNLLVRMITEHSGTNQQGQFDQNAIGAGIGGTAMVSGPHGQMLNVKVRPCKIQGIDLARNNVPGFSNTSVALNSTLDDNCGGFGIVPNVSVGESESTATYACTRRYQDNLFLGILQQPKLIPLKYLASQLTIELTLETDENVIMSRKGVDGSLDPNTPWKPKYKISNVFLIPEILEFDSSYDEVVVAGLINEGIPLKFASWHTHEFATSGGSVLSLQISERNRSIKGAFAVQIANKNSYQYDSHSTLFDSSVSIGNDNASTIDKKATLQEFQWRVGGKCFPTQPVRISTSFGSGTNNGGVEAYVELQKALKLLGDARISTSINPDRWAVPRGIYHTGGLGSPANGIANIDPDHDFSLSRIQNTFAGRPIYRDAISDTRPSGEPGDYDNLFVPGDAIRTMASTVGSCQFVVACDFETSNGLEISGLNAEEVSDIGLTLRYAGTQDINNTIVVFTYFDELVILRENNVLNIIQ